VCLHACVWGCVVCVCHAMCSGSCVFVLGGFFACMWVFVVCVPCCVQQELFVVGGNGGVFVVGGCLFMGVGLCCVCGMLCAVGADECELARL